MTQPVDTAPVISILLYHEVQPAGRNGHPYTVSAGQFERQLASLVEQGYRTTSFEHYWDPGQNTGASHKRVIITFDDAQISNYTVAFPLLQRYRCTATFFIPTAFVGRNAQQVSMPQLVEMQAQGMAIHSHSHSHRFLNQLSQEELLEELRRSKAILEQGLGRTVQLVACPGGRYNATVLAAAGQAGYRGVCTSYPGFNLRPRRGALDLFERFVINGGTRDDEFAQILATRSTLLVKKRLAYHAKSLIKTLMGHGAYHALWRRLTRA